MKMNLVHTMYRVQKYGLFFIERFKEMLRPSELRMCGPQKARKSWYSMPLQVFTSFVFRVRVCVHPSLFLINIVCSAIFFLNNKFKSYVGVTCVARNCPVRRCSNAEVMSKLVAVANPSNQQGFLDEVISYAT